MTHWNRFGIPLLIVALGAGGAVWLARQDRTARVPTKQAEERPQPPAPVKIPEGAVFRSLDKINAAAKAVGCPTLDMGDEAGKLFEVAECLGEKATNATLPGGQPPRP